MTVISSSLLIFAALWSADAADQRYAFTQPHMGAEFELLFYAPDEPTAKKAAQAAFARIAALDAMLSDYNPRSELSRLSGAAGKGTAVRVSDELWRLLRQSEALSRQSKGAFDVTVGPVVKLWRRARRNGRLPDEERLQEALRAVGQRHVRLNADDQTVELLQPNMRLDLGGIAKGFAADEALRVLREQGIARALVNASGDIAISDAPPDAQGWKIGIAPLAPEEPPSRILLLTNCAVATSGDAWQFVEIAGRRYSHIVDPKTGLGLTTRSSVTVIASNCTTADSLASAVSVLGPQQGVKLIEATCGAATLIVQVEQGRAVKYESKRMAGFETSPKQANTSP
jgi:thiamine biosynthesis lipoprotein